METALIIYLILLIISFVCSIKSTLDINRIKNFLVQPFKNKTTNYPEKMIELLQGCVLNLQHNRDEIKELKNEVALIRNGGTMPGMKSKTDVHNEEMIKLIKEQNELLRKIYLSSSGDEKKRLAEIIKQATDIINNE